MDSTSIKMMTAMMEKANEVFFVFNIHRAAFTYVNDAFEVVTRRQKLDLMNNPLSFFDVIHNEDLAFVKNSFELLLTKTESTLLEFRIFRPDNTERWIRLKVYPLVSNAKIQCLIGTAEDESARKAGVLILKM